MPHTAGKLPCRVHTPRFGTISTLSPYRGWKGIQASLQHFMHLYSGRTVRKKNPVSGLYWPIKTARHSYSRGRSSDEEYAAEPDCGTKSISAVRTSGGQEQAGIDSKKSHPSGRPFVLETWVSAACTPSAVHFANLFVRFFLNGIGTKIKPSVW
jgi:hypothetical protein